MADIAPQSISANLAGTGQIGGQPAQPGGRGPLFVLPSLSFTSPFSGAAPKSQQPFTTPIASFLRGGAHNAKGNAMLNAQIQYEQQVMAKINAGGSEYMRFAVADVSPGNFQSGLAPVGGGGHQLG